MIQFNMMTNRYSHSNVPLEELGTANTKGLQSTKSVLDDLTSVKPLLHSVHQTYSSISTPINSSRNSPTSTDNTDNTVTPGLSGLQGGWITGNSTERSSLGSAYSLDDIDRQASCTVTKYFDNIKSVLFEGESKTDWSSSTQIPKGSDTLRECQEWRSQFLHLRLLGSSQGPPQGQSPTKDQGYQCIAMETSSPRQDLLFDETSVTLDPTLVNIVGRGILPKHPPNEAIAITNTDQDTHNGFEFLREEIFAQDGIYEEIIAIDNERMEDNFEAIVTMRPMRRRVGYPPITPNACITNSVMIRLFDDLWKTVIIWIWQLIQKEYPTLFDDVLQQTLDVNPSSPNHNNPSPASRQPSFNFNQKHLYLNQRANTHVGGMLLSQNPIDGILQISKIPIKYRETLDGSGIITTRPGSSIISQQRPTTTTANRSYKLAPKGSLLPPLHGNDKIKEVDSMIVRKLTPHNTGESISPPPSSAIYQRNGALPPLHMEKERKSFYRASSAIDNKDVRGFHSGNRGSVPFEQRPSTTHAMRSDNRRSSTPLGQNKQNFIGSRPLNVTGSGLQPSSDYPHIQPDIVEDHEGSIEDGILHNNQWHPRNSSNNNRYRKRQVRYLVQT